MAYFASLDAENTVITVYSMHNNEMLDADGIESEEVGITFLRTLHGEGRYKQCSYNTRNGVHLGADGKPDGGKALRGNYCGVGWMYSEEHDIFHPPQPYPSWTLDEITGQWVSPVPYPEHVEGERPTMYRWNEDERKWDEISGGGGAA